MIKIDMKYFNTYYFCSLAEYLVTVGDLDFASTLAEFTDGLYDIEREDFRKHSYLHAFVEFMVERILFEQNKYRARDIVAAVENDGYDKVFKKEHPVFYYNNFIHESRYIYTMFELAIKQYTGKSEKLKEWIVNKYKGDITDELDIASEYTAYLEEYWEVIDKINQDVVYILFQNRNFLLQFNIWISDVCESKSKRVNTPKWVQRAVFYRDKGKCVICNKDLSGLIDVEENFEKQLDHMVPLEQGGLNDVSNIQLMCQDCNRKKGTNSYTSSVYKFWYDLEGND